MLLWFGGDDDSPLGLVGNLALVLLAPIAATLIQLAISRQREYSADATGAEICGNPESLASALLRLEEGAKAMPMQVNQATEPLYIVKPFSGGGIAGLFSTHPPIEERVRRLRQMRPRSASASLKYSVVVVTWECADHLRTLVATMNEHLDGAQELIVVDNASSRRPRRGGGGLEGRAPLHRPRARTSASAPASNVGVAEATGDATVLLNPDTELLDDGLDRLAAAALELGGLVGPRRAEPRRIRSSPRRAARRSAPGRGSGRWSRAASSPRRCWPAPSRTGSSAGSRSAG